jgi:thiomorpholine-carboxylate dehydrogenase
MEALIPAMEQALVQFSAGTVNQPLRTVLTNSEHQGWFGVMPVIYRDLMGVKMVTFYPGNTVLGLPTHQAIIQLFRASTGEPLATMDGRLITEMRTAAVSAIAAKLLAPKEANILAILGSGVQARSHFHALPAFEEVRVWSPTATNAQSFAAEVGATAYDSAESAVRDADVVVTVTSSAQPVLLGRWLKPNAFVIAVGAVGPARRELDDEAMQACVVVESRAAALRESGDVILSGAPIYAELGEMLAAAKKPVIRGRIVYKSLGIGVEDIAAARLVYEAITAGSIAAIT